MPEPEDAATEEPKIGVYICHCGTNIAGVVDVKGLAEYVSKLPSVTVAQDYKFMCSDPGQNLIKKDIAELKLNRVVVASCSPWLHERTFRNATAEGGLNPYYFHMVNIREHDAWVHPWRESATEKAKDLLMAAVERVKYHKPLTTQRVPINPNVLVVGGGIAGIAAAQTLAEAGKHVYLVEREPSLGGHMAKLDKTFPTLDCAACILTPKMVGVKWFPNLELLTYSEIEGVEGYIGNFKVKVRKKPRYVDEEKCTGCDDCTEVCPVSIPSEFDMGLATRKAIYRPFPQAVPNIFTIDKKGIPPCRAACPAGVNVEGYITLITQGKFKEALELVRRDIPFPSVCGRVCLHPCESECERGEVDEPVAIMALKHFVSSKWLKEGMEKPEPAPKIHEEKVAVIGSGPAGLTAAYELVNRGYPVTVFESMSEPGGMLRAGIPRYRLPKEELDADIRFIEDSGVEIKTNTRIGRDLKINDLLRDGYKAIFIATGAHKSRKLGVEGEELEGVAHALDFLKDVNLGKKVEIGDRVVVIGGGNTAVDASRVALRLGAKEVQISYRRSRPEMPANPEEVEQAEREGVRIQFLVTPKRVLGKDGRITGIEYVRMRLGAPDETGRRRPVPIEDSEFVMEFDTLLIAIGEQPDIIQLPEDIEVTKRGTIAVDPNTMQTAVPYVFAGGDVVSGPANVIEAIAAGKQAAASINCYLRGEPLKVKEEIRKVEEVPKEAVIKKARQAMPLLPIDRMVGNFNPVELGFSEEMAKEEATRCLMCGGCSECLECEKVCEPTAIVHNQKEKLIEIEVGTIVIATGFKTFDPHMSPRYGYGIYPNVYTSLEVERLLNASGPTSGEVVLRNSGKPSSVGIIHCIGSRDENTNVYCSKVCCMYSLKLAHIIKERTGAEVYNFYTDIRTPGKGFEEFYNKILEEGVHFIRGKVGEVTDHAIDSTEEGKLVIRVEDTLMGVVRRIPVDMVVLAVGLEPQADAVELGKLLNIQCSSEGFFMERHPKMAPVETFTDGIFLAGACQGPKDIPDTIAQANAAAAQALALIDKGHVELEPNTAYVDEDLCSGCKVCIPLCPYSAISFDESKQKVEIQGAMCKGCGACVSACPSGALGQNLFELPQIMGEIKGITRVLPEVKT